MTDTLDPVLAELIASRREEIIRTRQTRDDAEHGEALAALARHDAEVTAELPRACSLVDALRTARDEAQRAYFAAAATLENRQSNWASRREQIGAGVARTMPWVWREPMATLEARIRGEQERVLAVEK